tara:strand:- start:1917 stop:2126 length:210 start_codon:yes stop_codon:yes gene_type:complete
MPVMVNIKHFIWTLTSTRTSDAEYCPISPRDRVKISAIEKDAMAPRIVNVSGRIIFAKVTMLGEKTALA